MIVIMLVMLATLFTVAIGMFNYNKELKKEIKHVEKTIYCGDEFTADFLVNALKLLEYGARYNVKTIDGEYVVEVKR